MQVGTLEDKVVQGGIGGAGRVGVALAEGAVGVVWNLKGVGMYGKMYPGTVVVKGVAHRAGF